MLILQFEFVTVYHSKAPFYDSTNFCKLRAESAQTVLQYAASAEVKDGQRLADLGPGIRGGKSAYWCTFGKDEDWEEKLLEVLGSLGKKIKAVGRKPIA